MTTLLHLLKQNVRSFLSDYRRMEETGNLNSGLFFYIFKSVTRCKYLDMLIEGRIGTRAKAELMPFDVCDEEQVSKALDTWEAAHPDDYISILVMN